MSKGPGFSTCLLAVSLTACAQSKTQTYQDTNGVTITQKQAPLFPLNVHGGPRVSLQVSGKTYDGLRGMKPFYLQIPNSRSILFVTEGHNDTVAFHVASLDQDRAIQIDGMGSSFGWNIGSGRRPGDPFSDSIVSADEKRITVATRSDRWKEETTLNLESKRIQQLEVFYYDRNNSVTNRVVLIREGHWINRGGSH